MTRTEESIDHYLGKLQLPVTKEELINGLIDQDGSGYEIALIERLPRDSYESRETLQSDLEEISRVHAGEVAQAEGYDDYLRLVLGHVGDVTQSTKNAYNRTADAVVRSAQRQGKVSGQEARDLLRHLQAEFAGLRGSMAEVTDDSAPLDPRGDLPRYRDSS